MNLYSQQHIISSILKYLLLIVCLLSGITNCQSNSTTLPAEVENVPTVDDMPTGGIENLGATCYMNSTLQILALYKSFISNLDDKAGPLVVPLQKAIHTMKVKKRMVTSEEANIVFKALGEQFGWTTDEKEQCDASDLLHLIWGWMRGPLLSTENTFIQHHPENKQIVVESKAEDACMHYVALPSNGETCSMQQLFDNSLVPEQLEAYKKEDGTTINNVYKHKKLNLNVTESILPLQINRFATKGGRIKQSNGNYTETPFEKVKLQDSVTSSMRLKISQEQTTDNQDRHYTLVGFIWHRGSINSGHYKAYLKQKEAWVCYNDNVVTTITEAEAEAEAHAQEAYVCFYQLNQPAGGS